MNCLVYLAWPEKCFSLNAEAFCFLKTLLPKNATLTRANTKNSFLRQLPRATHVITWHFESDWFKRAKKLKVLATPGAGRELVAWQDAPKHVKVHFGHFHGPIIAESVVGFILSWARGFFRPELKTNESWQKSWPRVALGVGCTRVAGSKAVIAGYGNIGRAIGEKLQVLGVNVVGFTRANMHDFYKEVKTASWLILALPSDTNTDNFLSRERIKHLPKNCVVINIGRGNAIDEQALIDALKSARVAGAYLDVFACEPGPLEKVGKKENNETILAMNNLPPNLIRMPHSSAFCDDYLKLCFSELERDGVF